MCGPVTWTLRAPVPPKCVVSPLPSGLPYRLTVFGSILKTTHMQSQYWVPGSPTQAMMTRQHHGLFIRQNSLVQSGSAHETCLPQSSHCHAPVRVAQVACLSSFSGTTKVSLSVHAPLIVDTHMLTKILLKLLWMPPCALGSADQNESA